MTALIDGFSMLQEYGVGIAGFFVSVLGLGFTATRWLARDDIGNGLRALIGISSGAVILSVLSYALVIAGHFVPPALKTGSFLIIALALVGPAAAFWPRPFEVRLPRGAVALIGLALSLLLIARLIFLKHILVPPYSDSVIHFQIVEDLLHPGAGRELNISLDSLPERYYHLGFHSLAAWLTSFSSIEPIASIPLVGQLFLVLAPVSIALLAYAATKSEHAAWMAGLLGAIGWHMPAFAANWGKYPALSALVCLPGVLASLSLIRVKPLENRASLFFGLFLLAGLTLMHTRILVVVFLAGLSYLVAWKAGPKEEIPYAQAVRFSLLYLISLSPLYPMLAEFYGGLPVLVIMLVLLPSAFQAFPRLSLGAAFFTCCLWSLQLIQSLLSGFLPEILNRQFIEIMLYIPFSLLGGAGFAGVMRSLPAAGYFRWLAASMPIAIIMVQFWAGHSMYPDACCEYYGAEDEKAFRWIRTNTTDRSLVLTSAFESGGQFFGTDAGIWIQPLTNRSTNKAAYDTEWSLTAELEQLCRAGARELYIYAGGRKFSFASSRLVQADWAEPVFRAGGTVIYQVSRCAE